MIAPVRIDGLPADIRALGRTWLRKAEFHMTVLAEAVIEVLGRGDATIWDRGAAVLEGRAVGPIRPTREVRRVRHPQEPELQTIVVMVRCAAMAPLYAALSQALEAKLIPPPAHITLYSTDPTRGIGINDAEQLRERAPALSEEEQEEVREAMSFEEVFGTDQPTGG